MNERLKRIRTASYTLVFMISVAIVILFFVYLGDSNFPYLGIVSMLSRIAMVILSIKFGAELVCDKDSVSSGILILIAYAITYVR